MSRVFLRSPPMGTGVAPQMHEREDEIPLGSPGPTTRGEGRMALRQATSTDLEKFLTWGQTSRFDISIPAIEGAGIFQTETQLVKVYEKRPTTWTLYMQLLLLGVAVGGVNLPSALAVGESVVALFKIGIGIGTTSITRYATLTLNSVNAGSINNVLIGLPLANVDEFDTIPAMGLQVSSLLQITTTRNNMEFTGQVAACVAPRYHHE